MTKGTAVIPNDVYHADPAYSSSDLKLITNTCPDAFYKTKYEGQKKDHAPALKKAFRDGELCHAFTLEPERAKKDYAVCANRSTTEGKKQAAQMKKDGIEAITNTELELVTNVSQAVFNHPVASELLSEGQPELSFWTDDSITGLCCKARPDWLRKDGTIIDLKTTGDKGAKPSAFSKTAANLLYHLQAAHYLEVTKAKRFVFLVVEKVFPFSVGIYELDEAALKEGFRLRNNALALIKSCHQKGKWPTYTDEITSLSFPNWAFTSH